MPSLTTRIAAALAASCAAVFLSCCGCSHSDHGHSKGSDEKPVITGAPAPYSAADVSFANNMTAIQDQGMAMSRLVPDRSNNAELVTFASQALKTLEVEIQVLKALRAQWKEGGDNPTGGGGTSMTSGALIDLATIARLGSLHGPEFDTLWLNSMIGLDQGAVGLANAEVANGKNVDAVGLAKQIATARQAEIGQMQQLLAS